PEATWKLWSEAARCRICNPDDASSKLVKPLRAFPGLRLSEHLPHCAGVIDKLAIVRSLHHPMRNHNSAAVEALCGRTPVHEPGRLGRPVPRDPGNGCPGSRHVRSGRT